jgi:hypothetical protein
MVKNRRELLRNDLDLVIVDVRPCVAAESVAVAAAQQSTNMLKAIFIAISLAQFFDMARPLTRTSVLCAKRRP